MTSYKKKNENLIDTKPACAKNAKEQAIVQNLCIITEKAPDPLTVKAIEHNGAELLYDTQATSP